MRIFINIGTPTEIYDTMNRKRPDTFLAIHDNIDNTPNFTRNKTGNRAELYDEVK
jgi:hypothetical protein